jgi:hypothetical protein
LPNGNDTETRARRVFAGRCRTSRLVALILAIGNWQEGHFRIVDRADRMDAGKGCTELRPH